MERKILTLLPTHDVSPYGNPIPGLDELGVSATEQRHRRSELTQLTAVEPDSGTVTLRRVGEPLQTDVSLLMALSAAGVVPDAALTYERSPDGMVQLRGRDSTLPAVEVGPAVAALLFVTEA